MYAMKKLNKSEMLRRGQVEHVKAERNLLTEVDSNCLQGYYTGHLLLEQIIIYNYTRGRVKIVEVSAGAYHSLALSDSQLGVNGENSMVPSLVQISSIKVGGMMSLAIDNLGSLWMWGNCQPQDALPEGEFPLIKTFTPIHVWNFHGQTMVKVACGNEHIVALVSYGEKHKGENLVCYIWGNNNHGQLGLGDTEIRTTPEMVKAFGQDSFCHSNWKMVLTVKGYNGAPCEIWSCGVILFVLMAGY
ncbi:hypothetical protein L2E82_04268 [Cichorium intybus]|uniref:Uncharacterized protein n=1 Tax=Cichorium intybus TaxID=13427 RepID=A0ACB9H554_CICIN|nr:hypothetical protein L2E82_04268 [Cichorium intybus]